MQSSQLFSTHSPSSVSKAIQQGYGKPRGIHTSGKEGLLQGSETMQLGPKRWEIDGVLVTQTQLSIIKLPNYNLKHHLKKLLLCNCFPRQKFCESSFSNGLAPSYLVAGLSDYYTQLCQVNRWHYVLASFAFLNSYSTKINNSPKLSQTEIQALCSLQT